MSIQGKRSWLLIVWSCILMLYFMELFGIFVRHHQSNSKLAALGKKSEREILVKHGYREWWPPGRRGFYPPESAHSSYPSSPAKQQPAYQTHPRRWTWGTARSPNKNKRLQSVLGHSSKVLTRVKFGSLVNSWQETFCGLSSIPVWLTHFFIEEHRDRSTMLQHCTPTHLLAQRNYSNSVKKTRKSTHFP